MFLKYWFFELNTFKVKNLVEKMNGNLVDRVDWRIYRTDFIDEFEGIRHPIEVVHGYTCHIA